MAFVFNRLTYAALTVALVAAPHAQAHAAGGAQPVSDQPVATSPAPAASGPTTAPAPRPLDDDRYAPPTNGPNDAAAPVNRPPPSVAPAPAPAAPATTTPAPPAPAPPAPAPPAPTPSAPAQPAPIAKPSAVRTPPPRPAEPPKPEFKLSVEGEVSAAKVKSHPIKVGQGDTVNVIAERLSTSKDELIKLNKLKKPYELDLGQVIQIPTPKAYSVESGDTLYGIARRFGLSAEVLMEINDVDVADRLHSGQKIYLPANVHDNGPVKTPIGEPRRPRGRYAPMTSGEYLPPPSEAASGQPPEEAQPPRLAPNGRVLPPSRLAPPSALNGAPQVEAGPAPSDSQIMTAGKGRFAWPVSGSILSTYGAKPGGQRNDGLDIAAPLGSPVQAAAEGDVVYAGNQVPGFGNLVLIKHADGWVTAYAHLSRTEVKIKDHVDQGQEIGQAGQTGGVDQSQLHFEIRYAPSPRDKARPIDPGLVLPTK
ncbi:MAG TPA: peptidoglycan DD-metalloendopeptidase family protein [Caulobacteraceae bacterium]|jgi:murein DD-endopeptidase MepM/ murein hydrolase activator NlpD